MLRSDPGWTWRSHEISRIEGFSDAVFGFAITLLVISLEVPKTFAELAEAMNGFFAFLICFILLFYVWFFQYRFFRRYGLADTATILMNAALLCMVLFYVYPLKFLFRLLVTQFTGGSLMVTTAAGHTEPMLTDEQAPMLFIIYGAGTCAVFSLFALMYWHAYRKRDELELSPLERFETKQTIGSHILSASVGLVSVLIARMSPSWAGMIYPIGMGLGHTIIGAVCGRAKRRRFGVQPSETSA